MVSEAEPTYDFTPKAPRGPGHRVFAYVQDVDRALVRSLALRFANYFLRVDHGRNRWKGDSARPCYWDHPTRQADGSVTWDQRQTTPLHLRDFDAAFRSGTFDFAALGLPEPKCGWLDSTIFISPDFHVASNGRDHALTFESRTELGDAFPLRPALDREGATYTSFQGMIVRRILLFRRTLVANSDEPGTEHWFQDFRTLVSETVSLIDNTSPAHARRAPQT